MIIDSGSIENIVSHTIVDQLKLATVKHPRPYKIGWIKSIGEIRVTEQCKVPFSIGSYKDEVLFDIVDMDACHLLLGRPWEFDVNVVHKGKDNTYSFNFNGVRLTLVPLLESHKHTPVTQEPTHNNLIVMTRHDFEEEIKGEFVILTIVATGSVQ